MRTFSDCGRKGFEKITMDNIINEIKTQIRNVTGEAVKKAFGETCEDILVEKPHDKNHGDFATNAAMQLTRTLKQPPRAIAEKIAENMDFENTFISSAEIAGPGFINFRLDDSWRSAAISLIEEKGADYGKQDVGNGKKVMVEFVSANPTGPMHMGNARGGALGDSLAAVLARCGYDVTREFYLNDAGAQIEKLGKSLEARFIQLVCGEDAAEFPEDGYHGGDIKVHMQEYTDEFGTDAINTPSEERRKIFAQYALEKNVKKLRHDLTEYRIDYDVWFRETSLYKDGEVDETIELLKNSGYTYEQDGALWLKTSELGCEKDDVLVRANGIPTYFAVDVAYHRNKFLVRGFDKVINIWGADHHGHVARMKAAMQALGINPDRLEVILMQLVRLMKDGAAVKMSKRTGEMICLADLLEDIGVDATRFFFNLRQADSHFDFDLDLAANQSNDNPVYYVQYAHARICSVLARLAEENIAPRLCSDTDLSLLNTEEEKTLITLLASYPEEILSASRTLDPTRITRFLTDLASAFHAFYNACRIKGEEEQLMYARLKLAECTKQVIALGLELLGVTYPEKM